MCKTLTVVVFKLDISQKSVIAGQDINTRITSDSNFRGYLPQMDVVSFYK